MHPNSSDSKVRSRNNSGVQDLKLTGNRVIQMPDSFLSQNKQFYVNKAKKPLTRLRGDRINQPRKFLHI